KSLTVSAIMRALVEVGSALMAARRIPHESRRKESGHDSLMDTIRLCGFMASFSGTAEGRGAASGDFQRSHGPTARRRRIDLGMGCAGRGCERRTGHADTEYEGRCDRQVDGEVCQSEGRRAANTHGERQ